MLTYCQQFCNAFPAFSPPAWQRAWAACRTPRRLPTPLLHVTRTYPPTQHSATRMWCTPQAVSLCNPHGQHTRRHQPHVLAKAAVCLGAPDCFAGIVLKPSDVTRLVWHTRQIKDRWSLGGDRRSLWGEAPGDLGRGTRGFWERENETIPCESMT